MKNETGLNRFSEAHFIGEQNTRRQPHGDFGRDVELVRDQIDAAAHKATDSRFPLAVLML